MRIDLRRDNIDFSQDLHHVTAVGDTPTAALSSSPSWGTGGSVGAVLTTGSNDMRGQVTVTVGSGGTPAVNATCTITFAKAYESIPFGIVKISGGTAEIAADQQGYTYDFTKTTLVITQLDLPIASETLIFDYIVIG